MLLKRGRIPSIKGNRAVEPRAAELHLDMDLDMDLDMHLDMESSCAGRISNRLQAGEAAE